MLITKILLLVLAIPVGYLIAWLTRDELADGKKWFKIIIIASVVFGFIGYFYDLSYITWTCAFILIVTLISFIKSNDRKWVRKIIKS